MATKKTARKKKSSSKKQSRAGQSGKRQHIVYHRDGSIWAKGKTVNGNPTGYWEWFRKEGTKMRSGYFKNGEQVGEWTTYDRSGKVYKLTLIKPKRQ